MINHFLQFLRNHDVEKKTHFEKLNIPKCFNFYLNRHFYNTKSQLSNIFTFYDNQKEKNILNFNLTLNFIVFNKILEKFQK